MGDGGSSLGIESEPGKKWPWEEEQRAGGQGRRNNDLNRLSKAALVMAGMCSSVLDGGQSREAGD